MDSKRKAPFTAYEKEVLKKLARKHLSIIECKQTNATFNKLKLKAWIAIAAVFNASPQCQKATHQQLKKLWLNMKTRARDMKAAAKQRLTGGSPYFRDPSVEDDMLSSNNVLPTIKVDSDDCGDVNGDDDDDTSWTKKERISPETIFIPPTNQRSMSPAADPILISPELERTSRSIKLPLKDVSVKLKTNSMESLKIKLAEQDIMQREQRFQMEMAHLSKINEMKIKILRLEYAHKKRLYKIIEEEQAFKKQKTLIL